jgi:putative oxidoreductase
LPSFLAYVVGTVELIGGIALILGLCTRIFSALLVADMLGAILKVKFSLGFLGNGQGPGYEFELMLLAVALCLSITGSALYSLDSKLPIPKKSTSA